MTEVTADTASIGEILAQEELGAEERAALHHLTAGERAARLRALEDAKRDEEQRRVLDDELRKQAEEEARRLEEEEIQRREAEDRARAEAETRKPDDGAPAEASTEAAVPSDKPAAAVPARPGKAGAKPVGEMAVVEEEEEDAPARAKRPGGKLSPAKPVAAVRRG
jgi:translation initiation factor IF-2